MNRRKWMLANFFMLTTFMSPLQVIAENELKIQSGQYHIISKSSFKALTINKNNTKDNLISQEEVSKDNIRQIWDIKKTDDGFTVSPLKKNNFLGLKDDELSIVNAPFTWNLKKENSYYLIQSLDGGQQINLSGNKKTNGAQIISYPPSNGENTHWFIIPSNEVVDYKPQLKRSYEKPYINNQEKKYILPSLPAAQDESNRLLNFKFMDYYPSGLYVKNGERITFNFLGDSDLSILISPPISSYSGDNKNNVVGVFSPGDKSGKYFISPFDGMMYFRYVDYGFKTKSNQKAKINILSGGEPIPLYIYSWTNKNSWMDLVNKKTSGDFIEILGDKSLITIKKDIYIKSGNTDPEIIINKINSIMDNHNNVSGLNDLDYRNMKPVLKVHYMQDYFSPKSEVENVYMYATDYIIGMPGESALDILDANKLDTAWSIWHETGHIYQQEPWTWSSLAESSVNIFSLEMQKRLGLPLRIDDKSEGRSYREIAYEFKRSNEVDINDGELAEGDWIRLVMLSDLGELAGEGFYSKLSEFYRKNTNINIYDNDDIKINEFAYNSSLVSNLNLTGFFSSWKLILNKQTIERINKLNGRKP